MIAEKLLQEAKKMQPSLIDIRRALHQHAEVGFELDHTLSFVKNKLLEIGVEPMDCGKSGIVVQLGGKKPGKVFLLRADMDALVIKEEADVPFACDSGYMHACGHDMHTTMLLGAVQLLKQYEDEIEGTIKCMFQPAEEIFEGAHSMIQGGVLSNPKVDAALMIHVMAGVPLPAGTLLVSDPGVSAPAADYFEIKVQGKGCHGAMPNTGVDPLVISAHIILALQNIAARELALNEQSVLTIGVVEAGAAANAIPDTVSMRGSMRTFDEETRSFMKKRLVEIVEGTAKPFRGEAVVTFGSGCPTLINDEQLAICTKKYVKELLGETRAFSTSDLSKQGNGKETSKATGSEDFAYVSQEVPSIMLALAAGTPQEGHRYPQHHPMVTFDESVLSTGSAIHAFTALRWLQEHAKD
ncbi:MAG: amidohydrolase [Erysipelotrichaceae bacterium]|nr:amidohydrolase [Erysipelotrichaceae bacterium]